MSILSVTKKAESIIQLCPLLDEKALVQIAAGLDALLKKAQILLQADAKLPIQERGTPVNTASFHLVLNMHCLVHSPCTTHCTQAFARAGAPEEQRKTLFSAGHFFQTQEQPDCDELDSRTQRRRG